MQPVARRQLAGASWLIGLVVLLMACSDQPAANGSAAQRNLTDAAMASCLQRSGHGTSLENVYVRQRDDRNFADALDRCASAVGATLPDFEALRVAIDADREGLVDCLRERGWRVPDLAVGEGGYLTLDGLERRVTPSDRMAFFDDVGECEELGADDVPGRG